MLLRDRFTHEAQHVAEERLLRSQIVVQRYKFDIFHGSEPGNPLLIGLYLQVDCLADVIWQTPPRLCSKTLTALLGEYTGFARARLLQLSNFAGASLAVVLTAHERQVNRPEQVFFSSIIY